MKALYIYCLLKAFAIVCKGREIKRIYTSFYSNHFLNDLPSWIYYDYELTLHNLRNEYRYYINQAKVLLKKIDSRVLLPSDEIITLKMINCLVDKLTKAQ